MSLTVLRVRLDAVKDAALAVEAGELGAQMAFRQALVDVASACECWAAELEGPTRPLPLPSSSERLPLAA